MNDAVMHAAQASDSDTTMQTKDFMNKLKAQSAVGSMQLLGDWVCQESGWWTATTPAAMGVCKEIDNLWHSYVNESDTPDNSPKYLTMHMAMVDAESRAMKSPNDPSSATAGPKTQ